MLLALALLSLAIWLHLIFGRGFFWLVRERDDRDLPSEPASWPSVVAVVPARDEADVIARSIGSLLAQDYPGDFRVVLVDDGSSDGTAGVASAVPPSRRPSGGLLMMTNGGEDERHGEERPEGTRLEPRTRMSLTILNGAPLPAGWTGKLWAMSQGVKAASTDEAPTTYLLLTDADIGHAPDSLRSLVARAEAGRLAMVSLMAKLHCRTPAERFLIPAFVFFFDMLYPFGQVNDARSPVAAAAGGCMLVRRDALEAAGGIAAIRTALIDDCTLGKLMKRQGPIWLGLTDRAVSLRPYEGLSEIGRMVSRSAYAQLNYSPWLLAGTILGMGLVYLAPPLLAVFATGSVRWAGLAAWGLMTLSFQPMLRFYRRSPLWGVALPVIGLAYNLFTLQSAVQVWRGRGGMWKGRAQAMAGSAA